MTKLDRNYTILFVLSVIVFFGLELFPMQVGPSEPLSTQLWVGIVMASLGSVCTLSWCMYFPKIPNFLGILAFLTSFFGLTFFTLYMTLPTVQ